MKRPVLGLIAIGWIAMTSFVMAADPSARFVSADVTGKLKYDLDERGNRILDFSHCGYGGGGRPIPDVAIRVNVSPIEGDATRHVQAAIDEVSHGPLDANGFRGAVLLKSGTYRIAGQLRIEASGIVLRGETGTLIQATGLDRRALIQIGSALLRRSDTDSRQAIINEYVPAGAVSLRVADAAKFATGDAIVIEHPSTREWIHSLNMDRFPSRDVGSWLDWKPGTLDVRWDRTITQIDGDTLTLDAPLSFSLDTSLSRATIMRCSFANRLRNIGIDHLHCESEFNADNPFDEEHAWDAIRIDGVQDGWVRRIHARHFAGSAVALWEGCRRITVEDCESSQPVSEQAAWRRHTFFTNGQQTLFQRCRAFNGRHDFSVGHLAAGPNAFVDCRARDAHQFSGPIGSWASGVLFDNVEVDGGGLALTNRETAAQGTGWSAANSVLWNCTAPLVTCRMPPTAHNWAIGVWGEFVGDGHWRSLNEFVQPESLYRAQLAERMASRSLIDSQIDRHVDAQVSGTVRTAGRTETPVARAVPLTIKNGWLVFGDRLVTGERVGTQWWRGSVLPSRVSEFGAGLTRFVPGRVEAGFTDNIAELADSMQRRGQVALEHHWGLWYDRRRDDHQMIRRLDGEVWPPFYEQPWARSGKGTAWDGLSKYDLTKFNPWYFQRLKQFADECDRRGLVLIQQMYFQHNVLEAGAHWADFPWRPTNCWQETGFPEPPPYENRKRISVAQTFYDVTHPVRRALHRAYIRHCLDVLGSNSNVIFMTGEEFTGPQEFMEFWLTTIADWQREHGRDVLVGLSCTKDVQDAVLADDRLQPVVDVIDLKYWWYTGNGETFAPPGTAMLAPRQQLREWKGNKSRGDEPVARQIREYRVRFPHKAVLCSLSGVSPWTVALGGGSLPALPNTTDVELLCEIPRLVPAAESNESRPPRLISELGSTSVRFVPTDQVNSTIGALTHGTTTARWIDTSKGHVVSRIKSIKPGESKGLAPPQNASLLWLHSEPD